MESDNFNVNETFSSLKSLQEKIKRYKDCHYVELWIRDSRTLEKAIQSRRLSSNKNYNFELKYSEMKLSCIHGGLEFQSSTTGKRKSS